MNRIPETLVTSVLLSTSLLLPACGGGNGGGGGGQSVDVFADYVLDPPDFNPFRPSSIQGSFGYLFGSLSLVGSGSPMVEYLEQNCQGGISAP